MTKRLDDATEGLRDGPSLTTGVSQSIDRVFCHIDQLVERGNQWAAKVGRTDCENYIDGDIKFSFEHEIGRSDNLAELASWNVAERPANIAVVTADSYVADKAGSIGQLLSEQVSGHLSVICRWGQRPVFVGNVELINEIEQAVPSRFTVRFEADNCVEELCANPLGESVRYGFLKPCRSFAERELDLPKGTLFRDVGRDNGPPGMVKGHSDVVSGIASDQCRAVYDGFVLFSERGALAGYCVCLNDISERAFFTEELAKFRDAFRSSLKF